MDYFRFFPEKYFNIPNDEQSKIVLENVFRTLTIPENIKSDTAVTFNWINSAILTPDEISIRSYESPKYWWVILHLNGIDNFAEKWPIDDDVLTEYLERKYYWTSPHTEVAYYQYPDGRRTDLIGAKILAGVPMSESDEYIINRYELIATTIMDHYINLNDEKKQLKLIHPDYIRFYDDALTALED